MFGVIALLVIAFVAVWGVYIADIVVFGDKEDGGPS
jgi:purine-cytosine permease-like protein